MGVDAGGMSGDERRGLGTAGSISEIA